MTLLRSTLLAALAFGASGAMAGSMTLDTVPLTLTTSGAFTFQSSLHLGERQQVSLQVQGWSANPADLRISQLRLRNGSQTFVFDAPALVEQAAMSQTTTGSGRGAFKTYVQDLAFGPVVLEAGDWTVDVLGSDGHLKFASGLSLKAQASNVVPEPAGIALALTALGGLALVRRRRAP